MTKQVKHHIKVGERIGHIKRVGQNTYYSYARHRFIKSGYARRITRGLKQGKTISEARGHPNYEYHVVFWAYEKTEYDTDSDKYQTLIKHEYTVNVITDADIDEVYLRMSEYADDVRQQFIDKLGVDGSTMSEVNVAINYVTPTERAKSKKVKGEMYLVNVNTSDVTQWHKKKQVTLDGWL